VRVTSRAAQCLALGLLLLVQCGNKKEERFPPASDRCGRNLCTRPSNGGVVGRVPLDAGSDAGVVTLDPDAGTSFSTEVVILTTGDLQQSRAFSGASLEISAEARDGTRTEQDYGGGPLSFAARGRAPFWMTLRQTGGSAELLTTLSVFDTAGNAPLPIVERAVLEDIADNLAGNPQLLQLDRAHAVLHFTDQGDPAIGVALSAVQGTIAYDVGTTYSDVLESTNERGAAALLNLPAVPLPGGSLEIQVTYQSETSTLQLRVAQDAVTLMSVAL
jgi:hypothetical protein